MVQPTVERPKWTISPMLSYGEGALTSSVVFEIKGNWCLIGVASGLIGFSATKLDCFPYDEGLNGTCNLS